MEKFKDFVRANYLVFLYLGISILLELFGVFVTVGKFYIRDARLFLIMQAIIVFVIFAIKNNKIRHLLFSLVIAVTGVLNLVFIVVYKMTGTFFDFGMLNLRNDAMGIIESIPIDFNYFLIFSLCFAFFFVIGRKFINDVPSPKKIALPKSVKAFFMLSLILVNFFTFYSLNNTEGDIDYKNKLYGSTENGYSQLGITSNFFNELYNGLLKSKIELGDTKELENFIYDSNKVFTGTTKANPNNIDRSKYNVITILAETFEWFSFMQDSTNFPNGFKFEGDHEKVLRELYPNLYRLYDESTVMTNFHAREKTDISENISIIGSYPTQAYINYDYPKNTIPQTIPNVLKILDPDILNNSYHNGTTTYYNRNVEHLALGFEHFTATEEMVSKYGMTNYILEGERNLDSEMIEKCKEVMFPTDRRFNTYITSITMHGQFSKRNNLQKYYDLLSSKGIDFVEENTKEDKMKNAFLCYAAATMDFDRAIGKIFTYLEENNLLDKTIITVFGDHNAYYQGLSNYVKNIYEPTEENYTNLYKVPLMIRTPGMPRQVINKFTCTADIVPTIFDLLGINFNANLYFGNSAYSDETSILYSRAYAVFLDDKIYFTHINNLLYVKDESHIEVAEERALEFLTKLQYCDRIFHNDYFGIKDNNSYQKFVENLKTINSWKYE